MIDQAATTIATSIGAQVEQTRTTETKMPIAQEIIIITNGTRQAPATANHQPNLNRATAMKGRVKYSST